ncbi:MAG TPA: hypothetical protein VG101_12445 [Puia sp.]|jgi:hypothetical protein|nr:hypothetical protein [Puia sp.]
MNAEVTMEDRLWDYIDGLSSPAEKTVVESLIAANLEWQRKYKELLNVHQMMTGSELDAPSMRFTKNVMDEISRFQVAPATKSFINKNVIRGIGAFFLSLITGLLVYVFSQVKWSSPGTSTLKLPSVDLGGLDKFDYGRLFSSLPVTLFMLIVVVLGLVLLDLYLQQKKKEQTI